MSLFGCTYMVTERCNSQCATCNIWQNPMEKNKELSEKKHKHLIDQLYDNGVRYIDFTGGEPLLVECLPALMEHAYKKHMFVSSTTNCILFPKRADELAGKMTEINFSLDSAHEKMHNRIRGAKSYQYVINSISIAKKKSINYKLLSSTLCNIDAVNDLIIFANEYESPIFFAPVNAYFGNQSETTEYAEKITTLLFKPYVGMALSLYQIIISRSKGEMYIPACGALQTTCAISPDGSICLPCHHKAVESYKYNADFTKTLATNTFASYKQQVGKFDFCQECLINCMFMFSSNSKLDKFYFLEAISGDKQKLESVCGINGLIEYSSEIEKTYLLFLTLARSVPFYPNRDPSPVLKNICSLQYEKIQKFINSGEHLWSFDFHPSYLMQRRLIPLLESAPYSTVNKAIHDKSYLFMLHCWIVFIDKYFKHDHRISSDQREQSKSLITEYAALLNQTLPENPAIPKINAYITRSLSD